MSRLPRLSRRRWIGFAARTLAGGLPAILYGQNVYGQNAAARRRVPGVREGAPLEQGPLPDLPPLEPLFDYPIRDTSICAGHDGNYYLTGTTGYPDWWGITSDLQVWKSADLQSWTPVVERPRQRSVVWSIDRDGTWEKRIPLRDGAPFRPLWAPEIHFLKETYWITYSIPRVGGGL